MGPASVAPVSPQSSCLVAKAIFRESAPGPHAAEAGSSRPIVAHTLSSVCIPSSVRSVIETCPRRTESDRVRRRIMSRAVRRRSCGASLGYLARAAAARTIPEPLGDSRPPTAPVFVDCSEHDRTIRKSSDPDSRGSLTLCGCSIPSWQMLLVALAGWVNRLS